MLIVLLLCLAGMGNSTPPPPGWEDVKCSKCNGKGETSKRCGYQCAAKEIYYNGHYSHTTTCYSCYGTGYITKTCSKCNGKKKIRQKIKWQIKYLYYKKQSTCITLAFLSNRFAFYLAEIWGVRTLFVVLFDFLLFSFCCQRKYNWSHMHSWCSIDVLFCTFRLNFVMLGNFWLFHFVLWYFLFFTVHLPFFSLHFALTNAKHDF